MSPELAMIESKQSASKTHEFDRLTAKPARGGAMGENATTPVTQSTTERASVVAKVIRRKGAVTNFLLDSSRKFINTAAWEMENHLQAHVFDLIYYILYGNAHIKSLYNSVFGQAATYEFSGLDKFISTNRTNEALGGVVPTNLSFLDSMIDSSNRKGGARHRRAFGMSPEMLSKVSQLLTNVRLNQGLTAGGLTQVNIGGGWRLNAYRDIPIIETTATRPTEKMNATITLADVVSGGSLSDGTYYVRIAPITYEGEQEASDEQSVVVNGGGSAQSIRISLNRHHQTNSVNSALAYKVYFGTVSGTTYLNTIISAYQYDSSGTPTDDMLVGTNYGYIISATPGTDVPSHMQTDVPLQATGGVRPEVVYLWDLDPIQGLGKVPYVNTAGDQFNGLVTTKQLAEVDDYIQFLVKSYCALADSFEGTSAWHRGLRTE